MSSVETEAVTEEDQERMREEDSVDEGGESEEEEEDEEGESTEEEESASLAEAPAVVVWRDKTGNPEGSRRPEEGRRREDRRVERSHAFVELTSLDELCLPSNAARSIKYTCVAASKRLLVLGTSTGSVYVFARYASKARAAAAAAAGGSAAGRLNAVPLHVYTTKDGALHTVRLSPNDQLIAVGGESGRVSVLSLAAAAGGAGGAAAAAAAPGSPASALVHTVPGDARRSDRVNCLCWSSDSSVVYAAHASGLVAVHKIGTRRSVFRSAVDRLLQLEGPAVQMEYAAAAAGEGGTLAAAAAAAHPRLLISTPEATFVHELNAGKVYQVGKKPRNAPMGACWMRGDRTTPAATAAAAADDFVLAARQNGRIWEASGTGIVYKTHQLRQSTTIPTLDPLSFRPAAPAAAAATLPLQQAAIDTETARTTVHLGNLAPITVDGAAPLASEASSLSSQQPSTSSSIASSTVSSSASTVVNQEQQPTRLVFSAVRSTLLVADIDRSQLVVVSDLGYVIRDWAVCGADVFVLFSGASAAAAATGSSSRPSHSAAAAAAGSVLRKYTLFPVEKAVERLLARKAVVQAARLVLSVRPPPSAASAASTAATAAATSEESTIEGGEETGWPMMLIEKIQTALSAIKKKESDCLRRQLNELVCGGGRKRSIEEGEGDALPRRVSVSDRYLDRRGREEEEEEGGEQSEYEEADERAAHLRPATVGSGRAAAAAGKRRALSPRSEGGRKEKGGRRDRKEELRRAKRMLESESSQETGGSGHPLMQRPEHADSLRTLLELGSPPPIDFKNTVTVASVARNLAELARVAPPSITDLLVERRTSAKASTASPGMRRGARVVKAIRPQRPLSGGDPAAAARRSGGSIAAAAAAAEEERNSNVVVVERTTSDTSRLSEEETSDSENNVEWRRRGGEGRGGGERGRGKRSGAVFEDEDPISRTTYAAAQSQEDAVAAAAAAAAAERRAEQCERCGLHKSWLAVFLFGAVVQRIRVVGRETYARGGVPSTIEEWCSLLEEVANRSDVQRVGACEKCAAAMSKAMQSVPSSGRFCDGLRPTGTRIDAEAMREKVLSLPREVLQAAVFGMRTSRRKEEKEEEEGREGKENGVEQRQQLATTLSAASTAAVGSPEAAAAAAEEEEGAARAAAPAAAGVENGEDRQRSCSEWMGVREVLTAMQFALGREAVREAITQRVQKSTLEHFSSADWALLARLLAPSEMNGGRVPVQLARSLLNQHGMDKYVAIEGAEPAALAAKTPTKIAASPTTPTRGYGRRGGATTAGGEVGREQPNASWPIDAAGVCPMCSTSLTTAVGGSCSKKGLPAAAAAAGDAPLPAAAAAAAGESCSRLAVYPCGHAYHVVCIADTMRRRQAGGGQVGITPVCIVCRVRARRSKAAAAAK